MKEIKMSSTPIYNIYYLYKITNLKNGMIYIGVHATNDLNDGYMGSGKRIKYAIKKYGETNFKKEILEFFDNAQAMFQREIEIVNESFVSRTDTYNIATGGKGGRTRGFLGKKHSPETRKLKSEISKKIYNERSREEIEAIGLKISQRLKILGNKPKSFLGKKHTVESIEKMSAAKKGKYIGNKNPQFGTCWIWHEIFGNKKIQNILIEDYIQQGWIKTRKI